MGERLADPSDSGPEPSRPTPCDKLTTPFPDPRPAPATPRPHPRRAQTQKRSGRLDPSLAKLIDDGLAMYEQELAEVCVWGGALRGPMGGGSVVGGICSRQR